jgi:hypothetical protein
MIDLEVIGANLGIGLIGTNLGTGPSLASATIPAPTQTTTTQLTNTLPFNTPPTQQNTTTPRRHLFFGHTASHHVVL